jgi:hypothetical protein
MVSVVVLVTKFDLPPLDIDELNLVGRTETHVRAFASVDVPNDGLDERAQVSGRAVMHFKDDGGISIVFYRLSFAEIVRGSHGGSLKRLSVESLNRSAEFCTRAAITQTLS